MSGFATNATGHGVVDPHRRQPSDGHWPVNKTRWKRNAFWWFKTHLITTYFRQNQHLSSFHKSWPRWFDETSSARTRTTWRGLGPSDDATLLAYCLTTWNRDTYVRANFVSIHINLSAETCTSRCRHNKRLYPKIWELYDYVNYTYCKVIVSRRKSAAELCLPTSLQ